MLKDFKKHKLFFLAIVLFLANLLIFFLAFRESSRDLTFAMLDVGQGDALFIESPDGTQMLIDGGPPRKILGELRKLMSPFDHHIDAIMITNPDQDHIAGFLDVLKVYKVDKVFEPGTLNNTKTFENLKDEIKNKNVQSFLARKNMRLHLGGDVFMDILFPDRDVSAFSTNDGSVVARLSYGEHSIMLTGDATMKTEDMILKNTKYKDLKSDILKVGHHGSRTSTGEDFLRAVSPQYAFISVGKANKYGHPHREILDILTSDGAKIFRTDQSGTLVFKCDTITECEIKK